MAGLAGGPGAGEAAELFATTACPLEPLPVGSAVASRMRVIRPAHPGAERVPKWSVVWQHRGRGASTGGAIVDLVWGEALAGTTTVAYTSV